MVEVVVAGAGHGGGPLREPGEVLEHDDDLGVEGDDRRDVEEVASDDEQVDVGGLGQHPVQLAQVVVEIGHEQVRTAESRTSRRSSHRSAAGTLGR